MECSLAHICVDSFDVESPAKQPAGELVEHGPFQAARVPWKMKSGTEVSMRVAVVPDFGGLTRNVPGQPWLCTDRTGVFPSHRPFYFPPSC